MQASDAWDVVSGLFVSVGVLIKALLIVVAPVVAKWWLDRREKDKEGPS